MNKLKSDDYIPLPYNVTEAIHFSNISEAEVIYTIKLFIILLLPSVFHIVDKIIFPKCKPGNVSPVSTFFPLA